MAKAGCKRLWLRLPSTRAKVARSLARAPSCLFAASIERQPHVAGVLFGLTQSAAEPNNHGTCPCRRRRRVSCNRVRRRHCRTGRSLGEVDAHVCLANLCIFFAIFSSFIALQLHYFFAFFGCFGSRASEVSAPLSEGVSFFTPAFK
jgi:hypothetical protein